MSDQPIQAKVLGQVLSLAKKVAPDASAFARLDRTDAANTRFARSEITTSGASDDAIVGLELAFGRRHASASTNQLDPASLRTLVERAARLAKLSPEDPEWMPHLGPQKYGRSAAFDPAIARIAAGDRAQLAKTLIAAGAPNQLEMAGFIDQQLQHSAIATSAGLHGDYSESDYTVTVTARTPDGHGSGWAGQAFTHAAELRPEVLGHAAAQKAIRSQNPRKLEPGRYTVVLEPAAVAELLEFFTQGLNARGADEGRSFFSKPGGGTRIGEALFGPNITLRSDPANPALPSAPFDADGMPLGARTWVDAGKLKALQYTRYWAQKQGQTPTGRYSTFELLPGTAESVDDLVRGVERGVLITRFWYTRYVDPQSLLITGLTRDGVFLIEKGEIVAPVNNFRFNESPVTMLQNADALTRATVVPGTTPTHRVPALRTHGFNLASISEAV